MNARRADPTADDPSTCLPVAKERIELGFLSLGDLQRMPVVELRSLATGLGVALGDEERKQEIVLRILEGYVGKRGLMFGEGVAEVMPDGFGFLRSPAYAYLPSPDDIYLAPALVAAHGLRAGMLVSGQIRRPRGAERYFSLEAVEQIDGLPAAAAAALVPFESRTPIHPDRRLDLELPGPGEIATRVIDLLAPIGFGQRGLIVAPPRAGKTVILQSIARAIARNHPDSELMVLLVDERPEEVTAMERGVDAEVIASTFDEPPARHVQVAQIVLEKARCSAEAGRDAVILLDSLTRLARASNALAPAGGRLLTGGLDADALRLPRRFFGSARALEGGGSLTILATALVETGSRLDEVVFEELKGTGNMELVLDRRLAERRIYPAIDLHRSGTRAEERLLAGPRAARIEALRRALAGLDPAEAMELLVARVERTPDNATLLRDLHRDS